MVGQDSSGLCTTTDSSSLCSFLLLFLSSSVQICSSTQTHYVYAHTVIFYVGFEVFTAVTEMNSVFWDVAPSGFIITEDGGDTFLRNVGLK
jgi:hypothetical protein